MAGAAGAAADAGLTGLLVAPGPDLVWLTGYQPTAMTERLTLLILAPDSGPVLVVPALERPDAEAAAGVAAASVLDWTDGVDPYQVAGPLLRPDGRYGISDSAWAMHVLGLQQRLPDSRYAALTRCLPMLRAIKDGPELDGWPQPARRPTPRTARSSTRGSPGGGRPRSRRTWPRCCAGSVMRRSTSPWSDPVRTGPTRTTRPATG